MDDRRPPAALRLLELLPSHTPAGAGFNIQADGRSALAVRCENATVETMIVVRGVGLPTVYHSPELVTAFVPSELYSRPGSIPVYLRSGLRTESNRLTFEVSGTIVAAPAAPAAPEAPAIVILVLHFGPWPEWLPLFLETCRWNPTIDWLIMTDCEPPPATPPNVRFLRISLAEVTDRVTETLGYAVPIGFPYKLCDLRLAFGRIFEDLLGSCGFFGWSDLDVVYGDIRRVLNPAALENDVLTFSQHHLSGHFTLVRRTPATRDLHLQVPSWKDRVRQPAYQRLDEVPPDLLRSRFPVWAEYSFNTPLSPSAPWRDGTFKFPSEWYWQHGHLTNDLDDDVEFLYLHFMHWKGGEWPRACGNAQWERLERVVHFAPMQARQGFRINERGFFQLRSANDDS